MHHATCMKCTQSEQEIPAKVSYRGKERQTASLTVPLQTVSQVTLHQFRQHGQMTLVQKGVGESERQKTLQPLEIVDGRLVANSFHQLHLVLRSSSEHLTGPGELDGVFPIREHRVCALVHGGEDALADLLAQTETTLWPTPLSLVGEVKLGILRSAADVQVPKRRVFVILLGFYHKELQTLPFVIEVPLQRGQVTQDVALASVHDGPPRRRDRLCHRKILHTSTEAPVSRRASAP
mmetsp:Transcript_52961/g.141540  ORF Transcript_52961/g.141540 Transcript_52961/m.141540 type:complete len:236 (-) Transcript_52961:435-1142(-)